MAKDRPGPIDPGEEDDEGSWLLSSGGAFVFALVLWVAGLGGVPLFARDGVDVAFAHLQGVRGTVVIDRCSHTSTYALCYGPFDAADGSVHVKRVELRTIRHDHPGRHETAWLRSASARHAYGADVNAGTQLIPAAPFAILAVVQTTWLVFSVRDWRRRRKARRLAARRAGVWSPGELRPTSGARAPSPVAAGASGAAGFGGPGPGVTGYGVAGPGAVEYGAAGLGAAAGGATAGYGAAGGAAGGFGAATAGSAGYGAAGGAAAGRGFGAAAGAAGGGARAAGDGAAGREYAAHASPGVYPRGGYPPTGPDPRYEDPRRPDPRFDDLRGPDPRQGVPRGYGPGRGDPRPAEPPYADLIEPDPRFADLRGPVPRTGAPPRAVPPQGVPPQGVPPHAAPLPAAPSRAAPPQPVPPPPVPPHTVPPQPVPPRPTPPRPVPPQAAPGVPGGYEVPDPYRPDPRFADLRGPVPQPGEYRTAAYPAQPPMSGRAAAPKRVPPASGRVYRSEPIQPEYREPHPDPRSSPGVPVGDDPPGDGWQDRWGTASQPEPPAPQPRARRPYRERPGDG